MNDARQFIDTNVLLYAFDVNSPRKRPLALALMERLGEYEAACLSMQVLQEFFVNVTRKLGMSPVDAALQVARFGAWTLHCPDFADLLAAIELSRAHQISFWDAQIVRSAQSLGCKTLWTEDLSSGQRFDSLIVLNPFLEAS
jgi:predicted nucleic acid-binding protein